jgi:hypothetical protein
MAEKTVSLLFFGLFIALVVRYGPQVSGIVNCTGCEFNNVFGVLLGTAAADCKKACAPQM